jgi:hypothetical protein
MNLMLPECAELSCATVLDDREKDPKLDCDDPEKRIASVQESNAALDWSGPDDPENPLNWPSWKRYAHIIPPAMISFTG